jgi:hypothetical protein
LNSHTCLSLAFTRLKKVRFRASFGHTLAVRWGYFNNYFIKGAVIN